MKHLKLTRTEHDVVRSQLEVLEAETNKIIGSANCPMNKPKWCSTVSLRIRDKVYTLKGHGPCADLDVSGDDLSGQMHTAKLGDVTEYSTENVVRATIDGQEYTMYVVGKGRAGQFLCIYREIMNGDVEIAQVHKPRVVNVLDEYELLALDDKASVIALLFALFYDYLIDEMLMTKVTKAKSFKFNHTFNRKLKSKYDPHFGEGA